MYVPSTDHVTVSHKREIALAAGAYSIPVHSEDSSTRRPNNFVVAEPTSPLDIRRLEIDTQPKSVPGSSTTTRPIPFPSDEDIASVHGQGTVALALEKELATRNRSTSTQHQTNKSRLDIVVSDLDAGITLSGICMAFAGTGTHVVGAAPDPAGFWDHAWNSHTPGAAVTQDDQGRRYWAGTKHPMSAIPWSTFTAPGRLSGIFEVSNEQVHAASIMVRDNYQLDLQLDEVVPLAVALFNEEFQEFASRGGKRGQKRVVGVILRSRKGYH